MTEGFLARLTGSLRLRKFSRRIRDVGYIAYGWCFAAFVTIAWRESRRRAVPHALDQPLIVSLTSFPPRYGTLHFTLKSLLAQSLRPNSVILWIAASDMSALPSNVLNLKKHGLVIKATEDFRSFTKIVPALIELSGYIVTADDDQYYQRNWLLELVQAYRHDRKEIVCARAHRIRYHSDGRPLSYYEWEGDIEESAAELAIFPTGVGGVLYEPGIFHKDVTDSTKFRALCPTADDVWLYWMAALNGARFRKVGRRRRQIRWPGSQTVALETINRTANDEQIVRMISVYGIPH